MATDIPTEEPERLRAGDTLTWLKTLGDYPASDGWVLHYRLINATAKIDITASASGANHLVIVAAATTAAYVAGDYAWTSWVTSGSERYTIEQGRVTVDVDLAAVSAAGYDLRSNSKKTLDLVDAAMLAHGSNAWTQEYEFSGRRMKFKSVGDFLAFRSKLQAEVRAEEAAERIRNGERPRNKLLVRF